MTGRAPVQLALQIALVAVLVFVALVSSADAFGGRSRSGACVPGSAACPWWNHSKLDQTPDSRALGLNLKCKSGARRCQLVWVVQVPFSNNPWDTRNRADYRRFVRAVFPRGARLTLAGHPFSGCVVSGFEEPYFFLVGNSTSVPAADASALRKAISSRARATFAFATSRGHASYELKAYSVALTRLVSLPYGGTLSSPTTCKTPSYFG